MWSALSPNDLGGAQGQKHLNLSWVALLEL